ncbi:MAG: flagellar hook-length control protein FliK [Pirellulales bacterium]
MPKSSERTSSESSTAELNSDDRGTETHEETKPAGNHAAVTPSAEAASEEHPAVNDVDTSILDDLAEQPEATVAPVVDEQSTHNLDELGERPDPTEAPDAKVANAVAIDALVIAVGPAEAVASAIEQPETRHPEATQPVASPHADTVVGDPKLATREKAADELPSTKPAPTNKPTLKPIVNEAAVEHATETPIRAKHQPIVSDGSTNKVTSREVDKPAGASRSARPATSNGMRMKPELETATRLAPAANQSLSEVESRSPADVPAQPGDALPAIRSSDDTVQGADEPQRDANARTTSRLAGRADASMATHNAAIAAIANGAAPLANEPQANSDATDEATQPASQSTMPKGDAVVGMLSRPHQGSGGVNHGRRAGGEDELPRVDPARFVGRVAKAFRTAHERGGTLQLRLSPPELGSLRLELTVKEGVMTAALETETASARRVLLDHLPALRDRLAEQNIRVERFDVDVRREGGGQADNRAAQHQQQQRQPDQSAPRRPSITQPRISERPLHEAAVIQNRINDTGINLVA